MRSTRKPGASEPEEEAGIGEEAGKRELGVMAGNCDANPAILIDKPDALVPSYVIKTHSV